MGRSHAAAITAQGVAGGGGEREGVLRDEEELVIRFSEIVVWNRNQDGGPEQERPSFWTLSLRRHHVVLAPPRALLHGRAHVSGGLALRTISGNVEQFCVGYSGLEWI